MSDAIQAFIPSIERAVAGGVEQARVTPHETLRLCALIVRAELDGERGHKQLFETYLPRQLTLEPHLFHFEKTFEERATRRGKMPPPDVLMCRDLKPIRTGGAYRAAEVEKQPMFHGFDFGDTIELAGTSLERFFLGAGESARYDIFAYVWPLLWLRFHTEPRELVMWMNRGGELEHFSGKAPPED